MLPWPFGEVKLSLRSHFGKASRVSKMSVGASQIKFASGTNENVSRIWIKLCCQGDYQGLERSAVVPVEP